MTADPLQALASAGKGKSTRSVLRVVILALIAGAAVASRLFSVIRTCPVLSVLCWCVGVGDAIIRARIAGLATPLHPNRPVHPSLELSVC